MRRTITPKQRLATDVWRLMRDFTIGTAQRGHHFALLKELGLTPGHLKMLAVLQPDAALPMGTLAEACSCDASMATWLVDRLEDRGLVERRSVPEDRRVKAVALTTEGLHARTRILGSLDEPPADLLAMHVESLESLRRELTKLPRRSNPWIAEAQASRRR